MAIRVTSSDSACYTLNLSNNMLQHKNRPKKFISSKIHQEPAQNRQGAQNQLKHMIFSSAKLESAVLKLLAEFFTKNVTSQNGNRKHDNFTVTT